MEGSEGRMRSSCSLHSVAGDTGGSVLVRCCRDSRGGVFLLFSFLFLAFPYPSCILGFGGFLPLYIVVCIVFFLS